jgi:AcrR family transcriptional regulator
LTSVLEKVIYFDRTVGQNKYLDDQMPKIVDKQEKSHRIATIALKEFRTRGYSRTRIADIAKAAGIGKGTVYEYFQNKTDILRYAFDEFFEGFRNGALEALAEATGSREKLLALVDFSFDHISQWEDHCTAYMSYFSSERAGSEDFFSMDNLYDIMDQMLIALIREGQSAGEIDTAIDATSMARLLICIYDGIITRRLFDTPKIDSQSLSQSARILLTRGLFGSGRLNA